MKRKQTLRKNHIDNVNSFKYFFSIYAVINKWNVPAFHWQICDFLSDYKNWNGRTSVLQVFRSAAKSTITGVWIAWLLSNNPKLRIKIVSDTVTIAEKMVRHTKAIIKQHPLSSHLISKRLIDTSKEFNVKGFSHYRDTSVSCGGVGVSMTGSRCDILVFDDVEGSGNCLTDGSRQSLYRTVAEGLNLTDKPNNYVLYIGTPHTFDTIYQREIKKGYSHLTLPLLNNITGDFPYLKGDSLWPIKFNSTEIKKVQKDSFSKGHFLSQYQCIPYNSSSTRFDISKLHVYHDQINFYKQDNKICAQLDINDKHIELISVNGFWDPALSLENTDDSVFAIVFSDKDGNYYIDRTYKLNGDLNQQISQLLQYAKTHHLPSLSIETNGIGSFAAEVLIKQAEKFKIGVKKVHSKTNKALRLIEAWEARLSSGLIYISEQVNKGKLKNQLIDFHPVSVNKDANDFIDAAGSAILESPVFLHLSNEDILDPYKHLFENQFKPATHFQFPLA